MKNYLMKRQKALEAKRAKLLKRSEESTDINEVRAINDELTDIANELHDIADELADLANGEGENTEGEDARALPPANAETRNADVVKGVTVGSFSAEKRELEPTETMEYRQSFKDYVQRGIAMPVEVRAGEAISTADTGAAIPLTIMREVINTVRKRYGNLYSKVRKTSVAGGVEYPIGSLQATFKWISEKTVSPRQNLDELGKVSFGYHTAEIRIAQSFLSQLVTMEAFEAEITRVIAIAYMQAMDYGIVRGTGDGQMTGILNDARVTNVVTMTAAQMNDWTQWRKRFFSALPLGYRAGEFIFPLSTVESYLETMADNNNNPIFRQATGLEVGDGDAQFPAGSFFGRNIALVEPDILPDFDSASAGDVIGIFWQPEEYAINENFGFTMRRYFDEETNEWVDKALVVVDGKVLNPTGYVLIKKA